MTVEPNSIGSRSQYLHTAVAQTRRLLGLLNRDPFSDQYGSFDRRFWHQKTSDFPSAIQQIGVKALSLAWSTPSDDNPFYQHPKISEWCLAAIRNWMKVVHEDGSSDEWYPNERGWAGPTGFLIDAVCVARTELGAAFPESMERSFQKRLAEGARYLAEGYEAHTIANHLGVVALPLQRVSILNDDPDFRRAYELAVDRFLSAFNQEGWFLEYDGPDFGYLTTSISFLAHLHQNDPKPEFVEVAASAVDFVSYHLFPGGGFGAMGSRQTVHFDHFGMEYWAAHIPMAQSLADVALAALGRQQIVSPEHQEDHYALYRTSELFSAYRGFHDRLEAGPPLPAQSMPQRKFFPDAGIVAQHHLGAYWVASLKRGGAVRAYFAQSKQQSLGDFGWMVRLGNGRVVTSFWSDSEAEVALEEDGWSVSTRGAFVNERTFTPFTMSLFRLGTKILGWHRVLAARLKGWIKTVLIVGKGSRAPVRFRRELEFRDSGVRITDRIEVDRGLKVTRARLGDEFQPRHVPQSRYFQDSELTSSGHWLSQQELDDLNRLGRFEVVRWSRPETPLFEPEQTGRGGVSGHASRHERGEQTDND